MNASHRECKRSSGGNPHFRGNRQVGRQIVNKPAPLTMRQMSRSMEVQVMGPGLQITKYSWSSEAQN